jgi:tight adherence protein B
MLELFSGNSFLILTVLIFVAIALLLEAGYLTWKAYKGADAKKIEKRLQALSAASDSSQQAHILKQRLLSEVPRIERMLLSLPRIERLDRFILQAGLSWTVSRLLLMSAALGLIGGFALSSLAHQSGLVSVWVGAGCAALPWLYVAHLRDSRIKKFEQQLPDALDLMTRALRSGHAFSSALQMLGDEMPEPIANEFRIVHDEVNFGVSLEQALTNLTERLPSTDLRYFVVAVLIQREAGGNLTEVLGNLSRLIRERLKLLAKVRVMASEGRLSAWILGLMPFGLAGVMSLVNPEFMTPLWTDPIGIAIVKYMLGLTVIGVLLLRKIIKIRV